MLRSPTTEPFSRPPADPQRGGRHRRPSLGRLAVLMIAISLVVATVPVGASVGQALSAAGAVRGMELDIHPQMVTFMSYRAGQVRDAGVGTRLLPAMQPPTDRYLVPSQRDFLAVTAR